MSLGTLVDALSEEIDKIIADVFNHLPQKVHLFHCSLFIKKMKEPIHTNSVAY